MPPKLHRGAFAKAKAKAKARAKARVERGTGGKRKDAATAEVAVRQLGDGRVLPWDVGVVRRDNVVFLRTEQGNVFCKRNGRFFANGGCHKRARWQLEKVADGRGGIALRNAAHDRYLAIDEHGNASLSDSPRAFALDGVRWEPTALGMPAVDASVLTGDDLARFRRDGYIVLRQAIPPELVRDALRTINHHLGQPDRNSGGRRARLLGSVGHDIFNRSPRLWSAVNVLLGPGNVRPWNTGQQVALLFPKAPEEGHYAPDCRPERRYHIDGMGKEHKLCAFSLLCGVALSDQTLPNMGNLHVFPGSHLNKELLKFYATWRRNAADDEEVERDTSKPRLGEATQVLLEAGDAVIAHQLLAHRAGINTSEHIRYQLYYRVKHKDHANYSTEEITANPWTEFAV